MTNYEEEQALEIEALQSIFEDGKEFESVSSTEFLLKLLPYPAGEQENHVGVTMHITYTSEYPECAPEWVLKDMKGLPDEKVEELKSKVEEIVESSLGMVMVYGMAEACQDYLKENNVKALSMHEEMMLRLGGGGEGDVDEEEGEEDEEEEENQEEEEWKGLQEKALCAEEERITVETFAKWKAKFDEEMIAAGVIKREENKAQTGKQWFLEAKAAEEKKAAGTGDGGYPSSGGGAAAPVVYNAAVFGETDDMDDLEEDD